MGHGSNSKNLYKVTQKDTKMTFHQVVLMSLILTENNFHAPFWSIYHYLKSFLLSRLETSYFGNEVKILKAKHSAFSCSKQRWEHQNNTSNKFKFNNKDTRTMSLVPFWCGVVLASLL